MAVIPDIVRNLLGEAEIDRAIASSVAVRAGLMAKADEVQKTWVQIWESMNPSVFPLPRPAFGL
jgi:hypothetical protein